MVPEQVRGHMADQRSDVLSFGAISHEMLTGRQAALQERERTGGVPRGPDQTCFVWGRSSGAFRLSRLGFISILNMPKHLP